MINRFRRRGRNGFRLLGVDISRITAANQFSFTDAARRAWPWMPSLGSQHPWVFWNIRFTRRASHIGP
ncbi:MAG: hypothetical protein KKD59_06745 [Acidobacteria bacterium]|nr:hypothetical protein [Acidobacteriota bacterium]